MIFKNEAITRLIFLCTFCTKVLGDYLINFLLATPEQGGYAPDVWAKEACKGMGEAAKAEFEAEHGNCEEVMSKYIFYSMLVLNLLVSIPITAHFILVIYSYWREVADSEKGDDGEAGEEEQEPLMD